MRINVYGVLSFLCFSVSSFPPPFNFLIRCSKCIDFFLFQKTHSKLLKKLRNFYPLGRTQDANGHPFNCIHVKLEDRQFK